MLCWFTLRYFLSCCPVFHYVVISFVRYVRLYRDSIVGNECTGMSCNVATCGVICCSCGAWYVTECDGTFWYESVCAAMKCDDIHGQPFLA